MKKNGQRRKGYYKANDEIILVIKLQLIIIIKRIKILSKITEFFRCEKFVKSIYRSIWKIWFRKKCEN